MAGGQNFFKWDKIIKITDKLFIFKLGKYLYKAYDIKNVKWVRELAFLKRAEFRIQEFGLKNVLKEVDVSILRSHKFEKKSTYTVFDELPVIKDTITEYCILQFDYITECKEDITPSQLSKKLPELIFMYAFLNCSSIVHRDIKESNLVFKKSLFCKTKLCILNFNVATFNGIKNNKVTTEPYYKDPILCNNIVIADERSDVWSFGIMLYQVFSGQSISAIVKPADLRNFEAMQEIIFNDRIFTEDNMITYIIKECLKVYSARPNFYELYMKLANNKEFPKNLKYILKSAQPPAIIKKISIKGDQIVIFDFLNRFPHPGNTFYHIKHVLNHLIDKLDIDTATAYFSVYLLVSIIYDSRSCDIFAKCKMFKVYASIELIPETLLGNIKKMIEYCDDDVIAKMA